MEQGVGGVKKYLSCDCGMENFYTFAVEKCDFRA